MSNKHTSVYDWLKYIKANVVGINSRELRIKGYLKVPNLGFYGKFVYKLCDQSRDQYSEIILIHGNNLQNQENLIQNARNPVIN